MENDRIATAKSVEDLLNETERLRRFLQKQKSPQVRIKKEQEAIRTLALSWFEEYENKFSVSGKEWETFSQVKEDFKSLDELSRLATSRSRYLDLLKVLQARLIQLRSEVLSGSYKTAVQKNISHLENLVPNSDMRQIIYRRWEEVERCLDSAPLGCVVMMGALLEALLLARINKLDNKSAIFRLKSTPIDPVTRKPRNLSDWTLGNFIAVAHEMTWIRKPARDISTTIMEYRNLIHPEKQLRLGIILEPQDSKMFWAIFAELSKQLIESV